VLALTAPAERNGPLQLSSADRWIRSRLGHTIRTVEKAFAEYRFDFAASALYGFTWYEFCDWYLEMLKPALQDQASDPAARRAAWHTVHEVLETLLRTLHPLMPFITEEIWQRLSPLLGRAGPSIMLAPWPEAANWPTDAAAEAEMQWLTRVVLGVRQIRGEMDISPARRLPLLLQHHSAEDLRRASTHSMLLLRLAGLESVRALAPGERAPPAAAALVGELTLLVPMAGLIDPAAEAERLTRRIDKTRQEIARARAKLGNDNFVRGAPGEVVAQEQERLSGFETALGGLQRQLEQVRALEQP